MKTDNRFYNFEEEKLQSVVEMLTDISATEQKDIVCL